MRTTLTLDEDVAQAVKKLARKTSKPFKVFLNEVLRTGLKYVAKPSPSKAYRTKGQAMGLKAGISLDNIQEILADLDEVDAK